MKVKSTVFAFAIGIGSAVATLPMIFVTTSILDEPVQPSMFVATVVACLFIASPIAYFLFRHSEKLRGMSLELKQANARLENARLLLQERIRHDSMTGLLNREGFINAFHDLRHQSAVNALLIVDADHFKRVNDYWGHLSGDKAIVIIADAIKSVVREGDVVGRIGGEEFGVFLPGSSEENAVFVAERIRKSIEQISFTPEGAKAPHLLTVSIGGAAANANHDFSSIMRKADLNLFAAKDAGRNRLVVCSQLAKAA